MHAFQQDSPAVNAIAFNYYLTFGFLTSLWTRLFALRFWRSITAPKPEILHPPCSSDPVHQEEEEEEEEEEVFDPVPAVVAAEDDADVDGLTKGKFKFTLYYYQNINSIIDDDRECESHETTLTGESWENYWERLLRMRTGENDHGWYTCQDFTALNGNVVRFWDGTTVR